MTQENDSRNLPAVTADGQCTACGGASFTLAVDSTTYTPNITFVNGKVVSDGYGHNEDSGAEDAVRFFCSACGERHQVPEGLPEC